MQNRHNLVSFGVGMLALLLIAPANGHSLNKSITVSAGSSTGTQSSVNGNITVEAGAIIDGSLETVNGSIRVDENVTLKDAETVNGSVRIASGSSADDVSSVNGSIHLADYVTLAGDIDVVNGRISLGTGTNVRRHVSNVNGEIEILGAEVGGNLSTVNGDVLLADGATVRGDLKVEKPGGWGWKNSKNKPKIVIGPNSKVVGNIVLEREVELYVSDSAEVGGVSGEMSMDDAVRFSGNRP